VAVLKSAGTVCSVATGATREAFVMMLRGITKTLIIASMPMIAARYQVVFSMNEFVRRTPITWFAPPNCDERPPPFDF
jgi:hypothetical protein